MSFEKKEWKNRLSENPVRRTLTPVDGGSAMVVDVTRNEGTVMQQGDPFNAENMNDLEARIEAGIGGGSDLIAPVEEETSANAYAVGDLLIFDNKLYEVIAAIAVGNTLVPDVNIHEQKVSDIANQLVANNNRIYMDYHDGKYGYNTSSSRGADTFFPFKGAVEVVTRTYAFSTTEGRSVSTTVDLSYAGHQLLGAGITGVQVYNLNSVSTTSVIVSINGTIATISAATTAGAEPTCRLYNGTLTAYYVEE